MSRFREKSDAEHRELAKKLDVAELMSRPTVIPVRADCRSPEPSGWERLGYPFGYYPHGNRKPPATESLGDLYALRSSARERKKEIAAQSAPAAPKTEPKSTKGIAPSRSCWPEGVTDEHVNLVAAITSKTASPQELAAFEEAARRIPYLRYMLVEARKLYKEHYPDDD